MNDCLSNYKTKITQEAMNHFNFLVKHAELEDEEMKDKSHECIADDALEKAMKYGTYCDCVKAIKSFVVFTQMREMLNLLA